MKDIKNLQQADSDRKVEIGGAGVTSMFIADVVGQLNFDDRDKHHMQYDETAYGTTVVTCRNWQVARKLHAMWRDLLRQKQWWVGSGHSSRRSVFDVRNLRAIFADG